MFNIAEKIDNILRNKSLSRYKVSRLIGCTDSTLSQMTRGKIPFSENVIEKLLPILEVSREEFDSWILSDKYPKEILELALKVKQETSKNPEAYEDKLILTTKIDKILQEKSLSRTTFSKLINHSQSGLNRVIIGKEAVSDKVRKKLSAGLNVSESEILAWIVADKYELHLIESALALLSQG